MVLYKIQNGGKVTSCNFLSSILISVPIIKVNVFAVYYKLELY